jgi:hypothetical protein
MAGDVKQMARDLHRAAKSVKSISKTAPRKVGMETRDEARRLSSGTASKYRIEVELDHAFATRHGRARLPVSIINKHTGLFWNAWKVERTVQPDGTVNYTVRNVAPYAPYLEQGTKNAFARPLRAQLRTFSERSWARIVPPLLESALRNAFAR